MRSIYGIGMQSLHAAESQVPGDIATFGARLASQLAVRNRMKSVKSIQKITKAMKMVAASKLRGVQGKAETSRGLWQPFTALLGDPVSLEGQKNVVLAVSTDRGLCGGINSTVVKHSRALFKISQLEESRKTGFVILGEKAKTQLVRDARNDIQLNITETSKIGINFTQTSMVVDDILKNVEFDTIKIVFNRFNSVVSFVPTVTTVLSPELLAKEVGEEGGSLGKLQEYEIEGEESQEEALQNLSEFQFAAMLYNAQLENACSEQGARMSAMDSSSRNASDMLDRLTLSYNRSRQATITTELIEIISGAAALEG